MLYSQAMNYIKELTIIEDEDTGLQYLRPDYRHALYETGFALSDISDYPNVTEDIIAEHLKLEIELNNGKHNKMPIIADWMYSIVTTVADPAIMAEENDLVKNMMEYMKLNSELKEKKLQLDEKEKALDQKENVKKILPGMTFSKKST